MIGGNRDLQELPNRQARGNTIPLYQELSGLIGRILLAVLLVVAILAESTQRLVPGLVLFPVTCWCSMPIRRGCIENSCAG
jgi:hypothetical protein